VTDTDAQTAPQGEAQADPADESDVDSGDGAQAGEPDAVGPDVAQAAPRPRPALLNTGTAEGVCSVELDQFEGPLDLLLHLVRRHELDILDIPIAFVCEKYLEYIAAMRGLDLEVAGDYLVMAATLAYLKSRELVPPEPTLDTAEESAEEGPDPRDELIARLLQYQKFRAAADELDRLPVQGRDTFARGQTVELPPMDAGLAPITLFRLAEAYHRVLDRARILKSHEVVLETISVGARMGQLTVVLIERGQLEFETLFLEREWSSEEELRGMLVVTLMSVLELVRLGIARVSQTDVGHGIMIERAASEDEAREALAGYDEALSFSKAKPAEPEPPQEPDPAETAPPQAAPEPAPPVEVDTESPDVDWDPDPELASELAEDLGQSPSREREPDEAAHGEGVEAAEAEPSASWTAPGEAGEPFEASARVDTAEAVDNAVDKAVDNRAAAAAADVLASHEVPGATPAYDTPDGPEEDACAGEASQEVSSEETASEEPPAADVPISEKASADTVAAEEAVAEEGAAKGALAEEGAAEEGAAEEGAAEEGAAEEGAAEEGAAEEGAAEEGAAEEGAAEGALAEEGAAEGALAEEGAAEAEQGATAQVASAAETRGEEAPTDEGSTDEALPAEAAPLASSADVGGAARFEGASAEGGPPGESAETTLEGVSARASSIGEGGAAHEVSDDAVPDAAVLEPASDDEMTVVSTLDDPETPATGDGAAAETSPAGPQEADSDGTVAVGDEGSHPPSQGPERDD